MKVQPKEIISKCINMWDEEISVHAKTGMREYTPEELEVYKNILAGVKLLEDQGFPVPHPAPWDILIPTKHRTIDALKPYESKGDELEVWNGVYARIAVNEQSEDDEDFVNEVEKRTNGEISIAKIREDNKENAEKIASAKKKLRGLELERENAFAKIDIERDAKLKDLHDQQERIERIVAEREKNKKKGFLSRLFSE